MAERVVAAIQTGPRAIELDEFPRPAIGRDDALLRVEACGICGTDVEQYRGQLEGTIDLRYPLIPGHEPVGVIDAIGADAAARWHLREGDRVAVEPFLPCGSCSYCLTGAYEHCNGWARMMSYGFIGTDVAPTLWGGYATHMYLHPKAVIHKVPAGIAPETAVLFNPLGAGVRWGVTLPRTTIGSKVAGARARPTRPRLRDRGQARRRGAGDHHRPDPRSAQARLGRRARRRCRRSMSNAKTW